MTSTTLAITGGNDDLLKGYSSSEKLATAWSFDVMAPADVVWSNMADMMKLLAVNCNTIPSELKNTFDFARNPRIRFTNKKYGKSESALGWLISPLGKDELKYVWQEGKTGGFASFIGLVETSHSGVVILSNSAIPVSEMGKQLLKELN